MAGEFSYMAHQVSVNRTVESLFAEFADRSGLEDVRQFAETFAVAKRSGGELGRHHGAHGFGDGGEDAGAGGDFKHDGGEAV